MFELRRMETSGKVASYDCFFSREAKRRQPSAIRQLFRYLSIEGMVIYFSNFCVMRTYQQQISLGGGMPNPTLFPVESMAITLKDGSVLDVKGKDMEEALQYSSSVRYQNNAQSNLT